MKQAVVGILAHVDAGKTTLAETMLLEAGAIRAAGRVDHGDSHLDVNEIERKRGITIFSSQAVLDYGDTHFMFLDAPGHVDFSAEAERMLQVLDYAILLIDANDGIKGHTETLWQLLKRYEIPTFVFLNKMDLSERTRDELLEEATHRLGPGFADAEQLETSEDIAVCDEAALDELLDQGELSSATLRRLLVERKTFPCYFGSALKDDGIATLLNGMDNLIQEKPYGPELSGRVYKVTHDAKHERMTWIKVTGGTLTVKNSVSVNGKEPEKIEQIRIYTGDKFEATQHVEAGQTCAVLGLTDALPGDGIGFEKPGMTPLLVPLLTYKVLLGENDVHHVYRAMRELADEDPLLDVDWDEQLEEIRVSLMGQIQLEVLKETMVTRFSLDIDFFPGSVLYKETIQEPVIGIGHFEPLRHYAESHLLLEPLPRGSGVIFGTQCSVNELDLNWQRLILTNAMEREHLGVLTGSPITDMRITLVSGRAHLKHTVGGDFRQATYRAIRQGLMSTKCTLLEPWYSFTLSVPGEKIGKTLSDLQFMSAEFSAPESSGDMSVIKGRIPVSEVQGYTLELASYTSGKGSLACMFEGYDTCHNADKVIAERSYDPCADLPNTPDSVFCSHGAGYPVKWNEVSVLAHVEDDPSLWIPWKSADKDFFGK